MYKISIFCIMTLCLMFNLLTIRCDDQSINEQDLWPGLNPGVPGGVSKVDTELGAAKNAINYFGDIKVVKIENVYSQIVAGVKYYYEGLFKLNGDSNIKRCRITVVSQPWLNPPYVRNIVGCQDVNNGGQAGM